MYYESDFELECDECGPGPPVFNIPPPPRPDFLQNELGAATTCSENSQSDYDMCEAIPILDASYHSVPSLQTSAMILLCSVLLLIVIFVSSILIWKHKRKVQNFLPCKTPSRGALDPSVLPGGQSLTYEDPDMHLGHHRPLVMRQHPLNVEMLHSKGIHYPAGYPIQRSPPLFICSSPGPEPYRTNDNVYEELEHRTSRYQNCDRQLHSDEDFAEDELSLPGDRSINKSSSDNTTVATIYQERGAGSTSSNNANENSAMYLERNRIERNSLLSSASSNDNSNNNSNKNNNNNNVNSNANNVMRPNKRNSSSSNESNSRHQHHHHHMYHNTLNTDKNGNNASSAGSGMSNFFRFRTSRPHNDTASGKSKTNTHHHRGKSNNFNMNNLKSSIGCDDTPLSGSSLSAASNSDPISCSSNANVLINGNHIDGDTNNNSSNNSTGSGRNNYHGIDSEVERRNRINAQLSAANPTFDVATIFRDRNSMRNHPHNHQNSNINNNSNTTAETRANANYYVPQQHIMMMAANRNDANNRLSRTNPRADRRRSSNHSMNNNNSNNNNNNDEYLYHEPVYHDNVVYDPYIISSDNRNQIYHQPYMLPEFTTFRNFNNLNNPNQPLYNASMTGAMNSDSGYSQNTQNSGRSLWNRRKRGGNNNNENNNGDSIASATARTVETTATDEAYEGS